MTLYQLRVHLQGASMSYSRRGFTARADALGKYRRTVNRHKDESHRISLYQVSVPDRISAKDWVRILSDEHIPGLEFELLEESKHYPGAQP